MKIEIENYRGWDISFDTDKETFYAQSDEYDRGETKKSFASAKQYIDDFIKDNMEFKPVWIETPASYCRNHSKIKLIGIRKDKRFVYEGKDGRKEQLSDYSEKDYILCNEANDAPYAELEECRKRKALIDEEMKVIEAKIIKVGLAELKAKYSI
jgi:hypothetical protein